MDIGEPKMTMAQFEDEEAFARELNQHSSDCDIWLDHNPEDCTCAVRLQGRWDGIEDG